MTDGKGRFGPRRALPARSHLWLAPNHRCRGGQGHQGRRAVRRDQRGGVPAGAACPVGGGGVATLEGEQWALGELRPPVRPSGAGMTGFTAVRAAVMSPAAVCTIAAARRAIVASG